MLLKEENVKHLKVRKKCRKNCWKPAWTIKTRHNVLSL